MREHTITKDNYLQAAQTDKQSIKNYFAKSINKTEQQHAKLYASSLFNALLSLKAEG